MAYGHAERNLAAIRLLEAETGELVRAEPQLALDQPAGWEEVSQQQATLAELGTCSCGDRGAELPGVPPSRRPGPPKSRQLS